MLSTTQQRTQSTEQGFAGDELSQLLQKEFRPKTEQAKSAVETAVQTLAEQALSQTVQHSDDAYVTIQASIAEIDRKLSDQINEVPHPEEFQKVVGPGRRLQYLVRNTETDEQLKIRVMGISKNELDRSFKRYNGEAWDQSPIFKHVYEGEYGQLG